MDVSDIFHRGGNFVGIKIVYSSLKIFISRIKLKGLEHPNIIISFLIYGRVRSVQCKDSQI